MLPANLASRIGIVAAFALSMLMPFGASHSRLSQQSVIDPSRNDTDEHLLEVGSITATTSNKTGVATPPPARIKIVSYNIRWRGGEDLEQLIKLLKTDAQIGGASVVALQEVDRDRTRTGNVNTARRIAEALKMNYAWAAPPLPPLSGAQKSKVTSASNFATPKPSAPTDDREEETGVAIFSSYPMTDVERIVLPHEGSGGKRRVCVGATVNIGETQVRVYTVHAETRVSVEEKSEQLAAVLDRLDTIERRALPAVVLGDFNTWQPDSKRDTIRLFTARKFTTPFPPGQETFRHILVKMRLDWIWLRGFPQADGYGIADHIKISDHYPLWLDLALPNSKPPQLRQG